ncbi:MAG: O-methyltransferase [Sediminibacterium sp.]|jgi:predicted O-methyltransferase YrrM
MYSPIQLGLRYMHYWIRSSNPKGHGVHSPFVFELIDKVFIDDRNFYIFPLIEAAREELKFNNTVITVADFGAGSRLNATSSRTISSIAKSALKPKKFGQLLFRLVNHFAPTTILELGTSLGITTSYLAAANHRARVITMEGAPEIAQQAQRHFQHIGLQNIEQVVGNFDDTLADVLKKNESLDFVFIDGNHRYEPTLRYFDMMKPYLHEHSVLIFDDIHWSKEMEQAWAAIKKDETVTLTVDLFFIGLVFFRKEQKEKQHFIVQF